MQQHFEFVGTAHYLPRKLLLASEVDQRLGLEIGWTEKNTGVLARYECCEPESLATMAKQVVGQAMKNAQVDWPDIDLIIDCSTCRRQPIPINAALLQAEFGQAAAGIPCLDLQSTCLGFLCTLNVVNGLLATDAYRQVLIVCAEANLAGVNTNEPESAALMGDGAAAVIVRKSSAERNCYFKHETYAQYHRECQVRGGGHDLPVFKYHQNAEADFRFHMDGPAIYRAALRLLPPMVNQLIQVSGLDRKLLHTIPHQASPRAVETIRRVLGLRREKYENRVAGMGNLAAASIPTVLDIIRSEQSVAPAQSLLLLGTSAGYSQAAMIVSL